MTRDNSVGERVKIALLLAAAASAIWGVWALLSFGGVDDVIKGQLSRIKAKEYAEAYHDFTSDSFRETTSLEVFKDFIDLYPVLANNAGYLKDYERTGKKTATIRGILSASSGETIPVEWILVKEEGSWKIASIKLLDRAEEAVDRDLRLKVSEHLAALKDGDIIDAYYDLSSGKFQNDVSFDEFKKYVNSHPILQEHDDFEVMDSLIKGDQGFINVLLTSDISGNRLCEYVFIREDGRWKMLKMSVALPPDAAKKDIVADPEFLTPPVRKVLDFMLFGQIRRAYMATSEKYRQQHSFRDFENFIRCNNAIIKYDFVDIKKGFIDNGLGVVEADFYNNKKKTAFKFVLGLWGEEWRVADIVPIEEKKSENVGSYGPERAYAIAGDLEALIKQKLEYLKSFAFSRAYRELTSARFRRENSFEDFEDFIGSHQEFARGPECHFERMALSDNAASLTGKIVISREHAFPVKYDFTRENGEWKIDGFSPLAENEIAEAEYVYDISPQGKGHVAAMELSRLDIGVSVNEEGLIIKPAQILRGNIESLYFNVYIKNGVDRTIITLTLTHVESGSEAPDLTTYINGNGDTVLVFTYDSPEEGWPIGEYVVKVTSSTGLKLIKTFRIE